MPFRADEAARVRYEEVERYLLIRTRDTDEPARAQSKDALLDIINELGPAVDSYPTWHPLVSNHDDRNPVTTPSEQCGYNGLDHTRFFVNGFITCPYGDGQDVIDSVEALPYNSAANITAERLNVQFYNPGATPILVKCKWNKPLLPGRMIPIAIAMPLLLQKEIPCWEWSAVAETWETMRHYFLGTPHGSRSSLFVTPEDGQTIKKIWNEVINTGMFGPIKIR